MRPGSATRRGLRLHSRAGRRPWGASGTLMSDVLHVLNIVVGAIGIGALLVVLIAIGQWMARRKIERWAQSQGFELLEFKGALQRALVGQGILCEVIAPAL